ncbi:hypothetical protein KIN20_015779, partial [Parelaphostrongylus tenuis]
NIMVEQSWNASDDVSTVDGDSKPLDCQEPPNAGSAGKPSSPTLILLSEKAAVADRFRLGMEYIDVSVKNIIPITLKQTAVDSSSSSSSDDGLRRTKKKAVKPQGGAGRDKDMANIIEAQKQQEGAPRTRGVRRKALARTQSYEDYIVPGTDDSYTSSRLRKRNRKEKSGRRAQW